MATSNGSAKQTKAAIAAAAASSASAVQASGEASKPQVATAPPAVATKNANTITIMQKPNESKEAAVVENIPTDFEDKPIGAVIQQCLQNDQAQSNSA